MGESANKLERKVMAGELIIAEGSMGTEFYIIKEGEFEIYKTSVDKKIIPLTKIGPGEFFGEAALFEAKKRSASVRALKAGILLVINKDTLQQIIKQSPDFAMKIIDGLVNKIFTLNQKYSDALKKLYSGI
ncbi:MAG TPA: cyclic nucleotide-binding domain-containing protein [bacterium]|nr:cyclic nucleotide-binding domain-containing protein [bacterium]